MEGEVNNLVLVWLTVLASLLYCHCTSKFIPKGTTRLCMFLPVICLFVYLPLNLKTMYLCGLTSFFITWLSNFKLLLFAFDEGPLFSNPSLPLSIFIPTACIPIKILDKETEQSQGKPSKFEIIKNPSQEITKKGRKTPLISYAPKIMLFCLSLKVNDHYHENMPPILRKSIYCFYIYFALELLLAMVASLARALVQVELERQFDAPHRATSVQNFWGKRWNIMVSRILRPTVYYPVRSICSRLMVPKKWVAVPAVFATFLVSGVMHELIFYYLGRLKPTSEITCFFVIQGVWVGIEIVIKKTCDEKIRLPAILSGPLSLGFVIVTCSWLFFPPFLRFNPFIRGCRETIAFLDFFTGGRLVSPNEVACPYFM